MVNGACIQGGTCCTLLMTSNSTMKGHARSCLVAMVTSWPIATYLVLLGSSAKPYQAAPILLESTGSSDHDRHIPNNQVRTVPKGGLHILPRRGLHIFSGALLYISPGALLRLVLCLLPTTPSAILVALLCVVLCLLPC